MGQRMGGTGIASEGAEYELNTARIGDRSVRVPRGTGGSNAAGSRALWGLTTPPRGCPSAPMTASRAAVIPAATTAGLELELGLG